ncbi:MAG: phosphoheptose isomerase [Coxiellaceae bacterium]|nr:phosphoheptose isomerase [Coxiellaceae bacterium]
MKILKVALKFFFYYVNAANKLIAIQRDSYIYKIEEINENLNQVKISCSGRGAILITSIDAVIYDDYIIKKMPPHHACWLGYYYGKDWLKKNNKLHMNHKYKASDLASSSRYIIQYQNRAGLISYSDQQTGKHYLIEPSRLAASLKISDFESQQACYIGFLSGLETLKNTSSNIPHHQPQLRVVK